MVEIHVIYFVLSTFKIVFFRTLLFLSLAKPFWLEGGQPSDIHVESRVGTVATFSCKAGGFPTPEISWYINSVSLKGGNLSSV